MRRIVSVIVLMLPPIAFVVCLSAVREQIDTGHVLQGMLLMFGALAVMTLVETLLFKYWVLPKWGQAVSERLYAGNYTPEDDALVLLAERIRKDKDASQLPELERMVRREPRRLRAWRELADVQLLEFEQAEAALATMLEGAKRVRPAEDRAFLLYRAAKLCEQHLKNRTRAQELYEMAARQYPRTTYGRLAAKQ